MESLKHNASHYFYYNICIKNDSEVIYYENETTIWDKYIHIIQKDVRSQILENSVTCDPQFQPCLTKVFDCLWYVAVVLYAVEYNHFSSFLVPEIHF
jgi:hypothetical protein